jgi:DNA-binding NarL/FixJ family response regulator
VVDGVVDAARRRLRELAFRVWRHSLDVELAKAIRIIARQEGRAQAEVAEDMLAVGLDRRRAAELSLERWHRLSPREQEVTALVCLSLSNQEIAERLVISPETVKTHMRRILQALDLHSKVELRLMYADWDFSQWLKGKD